MKKEVILSETEVTGFFIQMMARITRRIEERPVAKKVEKIFGVPTGGIAAAYRAAGFLDAEIVDDETDATIIVDDIVATGKTKESVLRRAKRDCIFEALIPTPAKGTWYVFPWEGTSTVSAIDIPLRMLQYIGEDVERDGLKDTPKRIVKAWDFMFSGYKKKEAEVLGTVFENDGGYNQMVILRDIEFYSMCEHHALPFFGRAHIAYLPNKKIVGISKLARLVDMFSRRLQVQERLTEQIAGAIDNCLNPRGVAVMLEAQHLCMVARGVEKQNSVMVTSSIRGSFEEEPTRMEFLLLRKGC